MTIEGPTLFMSNHPNALRLYPAVFEIRKSVPNVNIVVDALFANFIKPFGFKTIETYSPNKASWSDDPADVAKIELMLWLGNLLGVYKNALQKDQIVDCTVDKLKLGFDVLICPSGITNEKVQWRPGVGKIIKKVNNNTNLGFVYIPKDFKSKIKIINGITVGSVLQESSEYDPQKLALCLQKQYQQHFGIS